MALTVLGEEHLTAIYWLSQPKKGGKTYDEIAKLCGNFHANTIYNWRKDPLFEQELKKEIVRKTQSRLPELMDSMMDTAIKDKNAAMAKLILTANNMLDNKVTIEMDNKKGTSLDDVMAELEKYKSTNE